MIQDHIREIEETCDLVEAALTVFLLSFGAVLVVLYL
jgi:hypothetical protein